LRLQLLRGFLHRFGPLVKPLTGMVSALTQIWMIAQDRITPADVRFENSAVYVVKACRQQLKKAEDL